MEAPTKKNALAPESSACAVKCWSERSGVHGGIQSSPLDGELTFIRRLTILRDRFMPGMISAGSMIDSPRGPPRFTAVLSELRRTPEIAVLPHHEPEVATEERQSLGPRSRAICRIPPDGFANLCGMTEIVPINRAQRFSRVSGT